MKIYSGIKSRRFTNVGILIFFFVVINCYFLIQAHIAMSKDVLFCFSEKIINDTGNTLTKSQMLLAQNDAQQEWKESHPGYRTDEELYQMAYRALEMEPVCVKKARMKCMLDLLRDGADERYLMPSYYLDNKYATKFYPPGSKKLDGSGYFLYAKSEILNTLNECYDDSCAYDKLSRVHDNIHNSYALALQLESNAALGGGSTYSEFAKAYHAWVSKMQHSGLSVYSAWTPECNGDCDDQDSHNQVLK